MTNANDEERIKEEVREWCREEMKNWKNSLSSITGFYLFPFHYECSSLKKISLYLCV